VGKLGWALVAVAVATAVLLWLLRDRGESPAVTKSDSVERQPTAPAHRPALPAGAEPGAIQKIPIARTTAQRDDGTGSGGVFTPDTLRAIRSAAAPVVQRCIAESFVRYPEFRAQADIKGFVSVVFTAVASRGNITVAEAHVTVHGFSDDELARCAADGYRQLRVGTSGQADGTGTVQSGYDMLAHSEPVR